MRVLGTIERGVRSAWPDFFFFNFQMVPQEVGEEKIDAIFGKSIFKPKFRMLIGMGIRSYFMKNVGRGGVGEGGTLIGKSKIIKGGKANLPTKLHSQVNPLATASSSIKPTQYFIVPLLRLCILCTL